MIIGISGKKQVGKDTVGKIIQNLTMTSWEIVKYADKLKDIVCLLIGCTREQLESEKFKNTKLEEKWWYIKKWYPNNPSHKKDFLIIPYKDFDSRIFDGDDSCNWKIIKSTPRIMLQKLGTDLIREQLHPNTWVNATMNRYDSNERWLRQLGKEESEEKGIFSYDWIITDVRFPNEAKATKDRKGILIRINRPGIHRFGKIKKIDDTTSMQMAMVNFNNDSKHPSEIALDDYKDWDYIIDNNGTIEELKEKVKQILIKENII